MGREKQSTAGFALLKALCFLVLAASILLLALAIPSHVRSVNDRLLAAAVSQTPGGLAEPSRVLVDAARIGPATLLLRSGMVDPGLTRTLEAAISPILSEHPIYALTGGPEPYFENYLQLIRYDLAARGTPNGVIGTLLPSTDRQSLREFLERSSNATVRDLLAARTLSGLQRLQPADSAAGAPLDGTLLLAALLAQGNFWQADLSIELRSALGRARQGHLASINLVEDFAVGLLSLSRRLDYLQLAELVQTFETMEEVGRAGAILRGSSERFAQLYAVLFLSKQAAAVADYLELHPETGERDLIAAAELGRAAITHLLTANHPRYRPPVWFAWFEAKVGPDLPPQFARFSLDQPVLAAVCKLLLAFLGSVFAALSLATLWRNQANDLVRLSRSDPLVAIRNGLLASVLAVVFLALTEPEALKNEAAAPPADLKLDFALADSLQTFGSSFPTMSEINTITLLILALFFVLQLVIYAFCLIKLREISRQSLPPALKIKLLENEEHLFDFGLYVGLGGTVASLILVVMGIVEASLMAAYASTLFGILFVALVKIMHLRPYRRKLILQAESSFR